MKKLVFISSPLRGDIEGNIKKANEYCKAAVDEGVIPLAPHAIFTQYLDDRVKEQRERGMSLGFELLEYCTELWVCGPVISVGMQEEIRLAQEKGIKVIYKTEAHYSGKAS